MKTFAGLRILAAVLVSASTSFSLDAPHLIAAAPGNNRIVDLSWRNNDVGTQGYRIYRHLLPDTLPVAISTISSAAVTQWADGSIPEAGGTFVYSVSATASGSESALSNPITVTIPAPKYFQAPAAEIRYDSTSRKIFLKIVDRSTVEKGHRIYRKASGGVETLELDRVSLNPGDMGPIEWVDSTGIRENSGYRYRVSAYSTGDSVEYASPLDIFTFRLGGLIPDSAAFIRVGDKKSSFPIRYARWAMLAGDSLLISETNSPAQSYTVLDVSVPEKPAFSGYRMSSEPALNSNAKGTLAAGSMVFAFMDGVKTCPSPVASVYGVRYSEGDFRDIGNAPLHPEYICPRYFTPLWITLIGKSQVLFYGDMYRSLSSWSIPFNDTAVLPARRIDPGIAGRYAGQWDEKAYFVEEAVAGGSVQSSLKIVDFTTDPPRSYKVQGIDRGLDLPGYHEGLLYGDPALVGRRQLILHPSKPLVYALSDTVLDIYSYSLTTYGGYTTGAPRRAGGRTDGPVIEWRGEALRFSTTEAARIRLVSVSGRMMASWLAGPGEAVQALPQGLPRGVYYLGWKTRSASGSARIVVGGLGR